MTRWERFVMGCNMACCGFTVVYLIGWVWLGLAAKLRHEGVSPALISWYGTVWTLPMVCNFGLLAVDAHRRLRAAIGTQHRMRDLELEFYRAISENTAAVLAARTEALGEQPPKPH